VYLVDTRAYGADGASLVPNTVVVNTKEGTVTAGGNTVKITKILAQDNQINIQTSDSLVQKHKKKGMSKAVIAHLILTVIMAIFGKSGAQCKIEERPPTDPIPLVPEPAHFVMPELNPLGVQGPLTLAGTVIIDKIQSKISTQLTQATSDAYKFGSVTANVAKNAIINSIKTQASASKFELERQIIDNKDIKLENIDLQKRVSELVSDLSDQSKLGGVSQATINQLNSKLTELESNEIEKSKNLNSQTQLVNDLSIEVDRLRLQKVVDESEIARLLKLRDTSIKESTKIIEEKENSIKFYQNELETAKENIRTEYNVLAGGLVTQLGKQIDRWRTDHNQLKAGVEATVKKIEAERDAYRFKWDNWQSDALKVNADFKEWTQPRFVVTKGKDDRYHVDVDAENLKTVSPLSAIVKETLAKNLESQLNGALFTDPIKPSITVDIRQRSVIGLRYLSDLLFGDGDAEKFELVRIGTTETGPTKSEQKFVYIPVEIGKIPAVRNALDKAKIIHIHTVTTTVSSPKDDHAPVVGLFKNAIWKSTVSGVKTGIVKIDNSTLTVNSFLSARGDIGPFPKNGDILIKSSKTKFDAACSVDSGSCQNGFIATDGEKTVVASSTTTVSVVPSNPIEPTVTTSFPSPTPTETISKIINSIKEPESEEKNNIDIKAGTTETGNAKIVEIDSLIKKVNDCMGGLDGMIDFSECGVMKRNYYLDLKNRRINNLPPPEGATGAEKKYVNRKRRTPFPIGFLHDKSDVALAQYFGNTDYSGSVKDINRFASTLHTGDLIFSSTKDRFLRDMSDSTFLKLIVFEKKMNNWDFTAVAERLITTSLDTDIARWMKFVLDFYPDPEVKLILKGTKLLEKAVSQAPVSKNVLVN
jgi:hypothetical protein